MFRLLELFFLSIILNVVGTFVPSCAVRKALFLFRTGPAKEMSK